MDERVDKFIHTFISWLIIALFVAIFSNNKDINTRLDNHIMQHDKNECNIDEGA